MALSKCPKCERNHFELVDANISNAKYKMYFVQCSSCGSVLNTINYYDPGVLAKENETKIDHLSQEVRNLASMIQRLR